MTVHDCRRISRDKLQHIEMTTRGSFHKFRTARGSYVYDFNTNGILRVEDELFQFLEGALDVAHGGRDEGSRGVPAKVVSAVRQMRDKGMLQRSVHELMRPPLCKNCATSRLNGQVQQLCLELTQQCNLRCRYCAYSGLYAGSRVHNSLSMSSTIASMSIDRFFERCTQTEAPTISFYGGEPLLNGEVLRSCVEYAKRRSGSRGIRFTVDTNGTLVDDQWLNFFMLNDFAMQISCDGPEAVHDRHRVHRNGQGSWSQVQSLLDRIWMRDREYYVNNVLISCTLAPPYPIWEVDEFFRGAREGGLHIRIGFVNDRGIDLRTEFAEEFSQDDPQVALDEHASKYLALMCAGKRSDVTSVMRAMYDRPIIELCRREISPSGGLIPCNGICIPGGRKIFVTANGDFFPCERVGNSHRIGNAKEGLDLEGIQNLVDGYSETCAATCHQCWAARLCSLCFATDHQERHPTLGLRARECVKELSKWHTTLVRCMTIFEHCPDSLEFVKGVTIS